MISNVDLQKLRSTQERAKGDPSARTMELKMEGTWNLGEDQPQFSSVIQTPAAGAVQLDADFPPHFGGQGRAPSPVHYCFYGSMACFLSTLGLVLAEEGVSYRRLSMTTRARLDFSRFLGVGDNPVVDQVEWTVTIDSDHPQEELDRLLTVAEERCPATWCLRNPVNVTASIHKSAPS